MKIHIEKQPSRTKPAQPAVALSPEAYEKLLAVSDAHNLSMRKLASAIICEVCDSLVIEKEGAIHEGN